LAINKTQSDLENAKVAAIFTVNKITQPILDRACSGRDHPYVQQCNCQGQTRRPIRMSQHSAFQIKAVFFHITKHFLDPHSTRIGSQSHLFIGQIGCQTPGLFLTHSPVSQQIHRVNPTFGQPAFSQPKASTRFIDPTAKILPFTLPRQTNMGRHFLTQNVVPMPLVQLLQYLH